MMLAKDHARVWLRVYREMALNADDFESTHQRETARVLAAFAGQICDQYNWIAKEQEEQDG